MPSDIVEATALHLTDVRHQVVTEYDIFKEVGQKRGWPQKRTDALFDGYIQEDFVKNEVEAWCLIQLLGTEGSINSGAD